MENEQGDGLHSSGCSGIDACNAGCYNCHGVSSVDTSTYCLCDKACHRDRVGSDPNDQQSKNTATCARSDYGQTRR